MQRFFSTKPPRIARILAGTLLLLAVIGISITAQSIDPDNLRASAASLLSGGIVFSQDPGVGIIGDSNSDEYRGDENLGGAFKKNTLNWVEQLAQSRLVNFGSWTDSARPEPRRKGFEFNWARYGARTADLINQGQHTAIAEQIKQGKIKLVIVHIGANDYAPYYSDGYNPIYSGTLSDTQISQKVNAIITNLDTALRTVSQAGNGQIGIIVTNIMDWNLHPLVKNNYPDQVGRARVTRAINETNARMEALAANYNAVYNDLNAFAHTIVSRLDKKGRYVVGGEYIRVLAIGDEPHRGFLGDQIHAGTVLEGLFANEYIKLFNTTYGSIIGYTIPPLTELEILQNAGIVYQPLECLRKVRYSVRLACLKNQL